MCQSDNVELTDLIVVVTPLRLDAGQVYYTPETGKVTVDLVKTTGSILLG